LYLVATGCTSVSTPEVADISITPNSTRTPESISTPFPAITVTAKTVPTVTDVSASTVELTSTIQPEKLAEVATIEAIITEKPELGEFYSRFCIINGYSCYASSSVGLSPNKEWAIFFVASESGGLSIVNVNTQKQWNIYYHEIKGYGCDCTVQVEHWSQDGHYLYVSPQMGGDGGMFWFWRDYIQLIRINLDNGTWVDTNMGASHSFSPNDKYIAYRRGQNVVVHDFQTGNEQTFSVPAEYVAFGRFVWSPDSKNIMFVL
jgi:hypothetical protein